MPSSDTISGLTTFAAATTIKSAEVNSNFSIWRGHNLPVDPNTSAGASVTYDLGSVTYRWRIGYVSGLNIGAVSTTGSMSLTSSNGVVFMNSTGGTTTASLPAGVTGMCFEIKNIGSANTVLIDPSGAETIDGTTTINLFPNDSVKLVSFGTSWYAL